MIMKKNIQRQQSSKRRGNTVPSIMISALIVFVHQMITISATSCHIISARPAFYPHHVNSLSSRSSTKQSSPASTTKYSRKKYGDNNKSAATGAVIQNVGLRKKTKSKMIDLDDNFDYNYNQQQSALQLQQQQQQPSLEELRGQLGPIGLLVSNTIELTIVTMGSFISGGLLGYIGGGIMNIPSTLFGQSMGSFGQRLAALNAKAFTTCKTWGTLSAAFSGFNNFVRLCRGDVDDGWNTVFGSALTGAFLSRNGGPQAMLQGAATYAGFTYFLDKMTRSPETSPQRQSELMYTDVPVDDFD